ncbi:MAG: hypothetical protein R8K49_02065 [Mariprofundaceae bacterium]
MMLLSSCGAKHHDNILPVVENPYTQRVQDLTRVGIEAMYKERWLTAEHAFERAVQASKLADDLLYVVKSQYNLAMAYKAQGLKGKATVMLQQTLQIAKAHEFDVDALRMTYVLALLEPVKFPVVLPELSSMPPLPADLYLYAGQLAQQQQQFELANQYYEYVLKIASVQRSGLWFKANAHLGLAKVALQQQHLGVMNQQAGRSLELARQVGMPRLSAETLLFLAQYGGLNKMEKQDYVQRAVDIYQLLGDQQAYKQAMLQAKP